MKIKIIVDNKIPFIKGALEKVAEVRYVPGSEIDNNTVKDADALIIRTRTQCSEKLLRGSRVRFIATATIGYDHIDTGWCKEQGIRWTNAPGCNSSSVEQYIIAALLDLVYKMNLEPSLLTMGIVGVGNVGSKIAKAAKVLGMKVLLNDPPRSRKEKDKMFLPLEEITKNADIITLHVPLTKTGIDKTFHLASESFFNSLGKNIIFINTSRGPVMSEAALKKAINEKSVSSCILDVWENEPMVDPELLEMSFIGTPHIAGYSTDGKINGTVMSVRAISSFFNLGLYDWHPTEIPSPSEPMLICDCTDKSELEIIREIYSQTYDIRQDDLNLREDNTKFESLRGNYPVRREPPAFTVRLINNKLPTLSGKLNGLGFTVIDFE